MDVSVSADEYRRAAEVISTAHHLVAFTGAGISVESGVPPFRGVGGIWDRYDPRVLEIGYFLSNPEESWRVIREIFYENIDGAAPNLAHKALAYWESVGILKTLITQNIDDLHRKAGNSAPIEYHGNSRMLVCTETGRRYEATAERLASIPPLSDEGALLRPDIVFFDEGIPAETARLAETAARGADVMLVVGTTGEVYPAAALPTMAKHNGATIIEINTGQSAYSATITDIALCAPATEAMDSLSRLV
ncbi:MAG: RNA polymerase subunit sigma [Spirochaetales bacterium]|nr:RNA polymerase subunit sigma [Spirochaetales bacterium]